MREPVMNKKKSVTIKNMAHTTLINFELDDLWDKKIKHGIADDNSKAAC